MRPVLGDWVRDQYGRHGRVTAIHWECPEGAAWIAGQEIQVTQEQIDGDWVSVLIDGGGSIAAPIDTVTLLDDPPKVLSNPGAARYFREAS